MGKILIICGPTSSGKTSLGVLLAKKFRGEIVSADSRQVYRGMDIGTGKEINKQANKFRLNKSISTEKYKIGYYVLNGVKIWLLDVVEPDYQFSVADYIQCAKMVIKNIWKRGKLPIIVGGTGFYIKGLVEGIETLGIEPNWKLRKRLSKLEIGELGDELKRLDPERWERTNESDRKNFRRLARAIEIILENKEEKIKTKKHQGKLKIDKILWIGLKIPNHALYRRIDKRIGDRLRQGIEDEVRNLLKKGYDWKNSALGTTLGYREWRDFFEGNISKKEIVQRWQYNEHHYAKRQLTWFRRQEKINWFEITKNGCQEKVEKLVKEWYTSRKYAEKS